MDEWTTALTAAGALALLRLGEAAAPMFAGRRSWTPHAWRNLALGLGNAVVVSTVMVGGLLWAAEWSRRSGFGLFHRLEWDAAWLELAFTWLAAFLVLDLYHYVFHVACHLVPPLWRFHAVHHHDEEVDVTSSMRFHTVEVVLQCFGTIPLVMLLGLTMPQLLVYQAILLPVAMFHHANIRLPARLDGVLRLVIVTPRMHWVHHSRWQPETDSNYSSVLSVWDRLFCTFRLRPDPTTIDFGLDGFEERDHATLRGMITTPFCERKSELGEPPPPEALRATNEPKAARRAAPSPAPPRSSRRPARAATSR